MDLSSDSNKLTDFRRNSPLTQQSSRSCVSSHDCARRWARHFFGLAGDADDCGKCLLRNVHGNIGLLASIGLRGHHEKVTRELTDCGHKALRTERRTWNPETWSLPIASLFDDCSNVIGSAKKVKIGSCSSYSFGFDVPVVVHASKTIIVRCIDSKFEAKCQDKKAKTRYDNVSLWSSRAEVLLTLLRRHITNTQMKVF